MITEKKCGQCKKILPLDKFHKKTSTTYQSKCIECDNEYHRMRYAQNSARELNRTHNKKRSYVDQILTYLNDQCCVDCGEEDLIVLEFDHVRGEKVGNVMKLAASGAIEKAFAEIEKCEVVCSNCHKRRTYKRAGSRRLNY